MSTIPSTDAPPRVRRLLGALDGVDLTAADEALITTLATLPTDDVDQLRSLLTRKGRAGRAQEQAARRQRRAERQTEDADFADAARRMIRALGRRGAWSELYRLEAELAAAEQVAVDRMRSEGFSWADIGTTVGVTKQTVYKRFQRQPEADDQLTNNAGAGDHIEYAREDLEDAGTPVPDGVGGYSVGGRVPQPCGGAS